MKKRILFIMIMVIMAMAMAGCSNTKLAEGFEEKEVENSAREIVNHLVSGEYDTIISGMSQELQEVITAADLAANMEVMNAQTGAFEKFKSVAVVGQEGADGTEAAVAVVVAVFENRDVTYTISYNTDMEIIGLWMK